MTPLRSQWSDQAARRRLIAILAGTLILLELGAGRFDATHTLRQPLMLAATLIAGADIGYRALAGIRRRQITIELLVTVAATGAIVIGEVWEAAAVTFLFIFGAWLEARTMGKTRQALSLLLDLAPVTALVIRDGDTIEVDPSEVIPGEIVLVRPGSRIPVDGVVTDGRSAVDESAITGESIPAEKSAGSEVFAGTVSHDGVLMVDAQGVGANTTLARIVHRVEEAQESKALAQRTIERFASWYTPAIMLLAAGTWVVSRDVELALTLLVIGCPGALVIATPVAIVAGIGRAAGRGILIKGGEHLETVGRVTTLALDKTGTLTQGKPKLTDVVVLQPALVAAGPSNGNAWSRTDVLRWAAIAEIGSAHPLARSIVDAARLELGTSIPQPDTGDAVAGHGIWSSWQGHTIGVGTPTLMTQRDIEVTPDAARHLAMLQDAGKTAMLVSLDDEMIGVIGVTDVPRKEAPRLPGLLKESGVRRLAMLTGDHARTAGIIGKAVGISEIHAEMLPEDKLAWVQAAQARGEIVAMVGDGMNDAPAFWQWRMSASRWVLRGVISPSKRPISP